MNRSLKIFLLVSLITLFYIPFVFCQAPPDKVAGIPVNYDESLSGTYALPDPLIFPDSRKVKNAKQWNNERRPQIVSLFEEFEYGRIPAAAKGAAFRVFDKGTPALSGKAIRKQVTVYLTEDTSEHSMDLLIYLPAGADKPVPVFFNVSFSPNASVVDDPGIRAGYMWGRDGKKVPVQRTGKFGRIDPDIFLSRGIGFATVYYGDIEPDFADGYKYGIRGHYLKDGQNYPAPDQWGAISAWSWGLSRAMDYLVSDKQIDSRKVALFGISRLGKTVLWTGCRDSRFGMVIASCSGEGGAAVSRRLYGETIDHMTHPTRYFYQFAGNWRNFKDDPSKSPVEANMLVSLMAPRPLLLQTGDADKWSDPKGEFVAAEAAGKVYELLGKKSLGTDVYPPAGKPVLNDLGYFMHSGGHGALPADYEIFIEFMQKHFFQPEPEQATELPEGVRIRKIWGNENYNAFTSLINFRGKLYCAFREGENHVYGRDGVARIISSKDGINWESVAVLGKEGYDLRDPKLSVTPDGRIMVVIGGSVYKGKELLSQLTHVSFSDRSGKNFSDPSPISVSPDVKTDFDWLWRVTWHENTGYGVIYQRSGEWAISLMKTTDGIHYDLVTRLEVTGRPNESTIRMSPDGEMLMMIRREGESKEGIWGRSRAPFMDWSWSPVGMQLGGPDFIVFSKDLVVSGTRVYDPEGAYTALFKGDVSGSFKKMLRLPSGGDNSYPGFVLRGKTLYVSYYSSHEGKTSIYLAEVPLEYISGFAKGTQD